MIQQVKHNASIKRTAAYFSVFWTEIVCNEKKGLVFALHYKYLKDISNSVHIGLIYTHVWLYICISYILYVYEMLKNPKLIL